MGEAAWFFLFLLMLKDCRNQGKYSVQRGKITCYGWLKFATVLCGCFRGYSPRPFFGRQGSYPRRRIASWNCNAILRGTAGQLDLTLKQTCLLRLTCFKALLRIWVGTNDLADVLWIWHTERLQHSVSSRRNPKYISCAGTDLTVPLINCSHGKIQFAWLSSKPAYVFICGRMSDTICQ